MRPLPHVNLGGRTVGDGRPTFVIAEAGVNHNGDPELALRLVDAAAEAGADAIKFQTFDPDELVTETAQRAAYQVADGSDPQREMLRRLTLPADDFRRLRTRAHERGLLFLSTPFDLSSLGVLVELGVSAIKVGSGDLTNLPFLRHVGAAGLPVILSTGMANLGEIEEGLAALGDAPVVLLHCVSAYPAAPDDCNLRAMATMRAAFGVPVGFSDHTQGAAVALAAAALGAAVVEKHLTLDRSLPGPDHAASLEPGEFAAMVRGVRAVEAALGDGIKRARPAEADVMAAARRSLVAAADLPAGARLEERMIGVKRPGTGIAPRHLPLVLGRRLARDLRRDELLTWDVLRP